MTIQLSTRAVVLRASDELQQSFRALITAVAEPSDTDTVSAISNLCPTSIALAPPAASKTNALSTQHFPFNFSSSLPHYIGHRRQH